MLYPLLIVEDERHTRAGLVAALEDLYDVYEAASAEDAISLLDKDQFAVVLTDLKLGGKSGMAVIEKANSLPTPPPCIMMTAYGDVGTAVQAMKRGAYDFLTKPLNLDHVELLIKQALNRSKLTASPSPTPPSKPPKLNNSSGLIGSSEAFQKALHEAQKVAPSKATVLLEGESGTGKEVFAHFIHHASPRSSKTFSAIHCAALASQLLESELFGHEKGAFTGAHEKRVGRFEAADGGTVFLDEIGEIDPPTQVKLLRFLETKSFERVGSTQSIKVNIRLIAATNKNLAELVKTGDFREDLYYRLNVVRLELPPLRQRTHDIPPLLDSFIYKFASEYNVKAPQLDPSAITLLQGYTWPGNVRELRNTAENLVVMHPGESLEADDLDPKFHYRESEQPTPATQQSSLDASKEDFEKERYREALIHAGGNRTLAAEKLGVSRRTLHRKLLKWPDLGDL